MNRANAMLKTRRLDNFPRSLWRRTGTTGLETFLPSALLLPGWLRKASRNCDRGLLLALAGLLSGCHSMGPTTISQDRVNYSDAIAESWKDQVLRNIVKLRYMDTPILSAAFQVVLGGVLVFITGIAIGSS